MALLNDFMMSLRPELEELMENYKVLSNPRRVVIPTYYGF